MSQFTVNELEDRMAELFRECQSGSLSLPSGSMEFLDEYFCAEYSSIGDCGPLFGALGKKDKKGGIGGAVGSLRGDRAADPGSVLSPITNRGVTMYQRPESAELQLGGYDGGAEVSFEGGWDSSFSDLLARLEEAKQFASEQSQAFVIDLCGLPVLVEPTGANSGLHYKYVFTLAGVKIFIHHNAPAGKPGVRVRYSAMSLIGRNLFSLHLGVLSFLKELGFTVHKERLSRVDMQVLVDEEMNELMNLVYGGHDVCRAQKDSIRRKGAKFETYTRGRGGVLELCIYDKKAELKNLYVSDPIKFQQVLEKCVGEEWFFGEAPITRVEFRLWRDSLRALSIDTVSDLQDRESALVEWLTSRWFRLLADPKVRGSENTAVIHRIWDKVQKMFQKYFPGRVIETENKPVEWKRPESLSCDPKPLIRQALGCLAKASTLQFGLQESAFKTFELVSGVIRNSMDKLYDRTTDVPSKSILIFSHKLFCHFDLRRLFSFRLVSASVRPAGRIDGGWMSARSKNRLNSGRGRGIM